MRSFPERLRIALLSYRGNPLSGGQGVYVRYLSRALVEAGHHVEVFAGPPYPELDDGIPLTKVPSLDLYRAGDPFRRPRLDEFRSAIDVLEYASMCAAGYPEPLTFSLRAARLLEARRLEFDVVHDNQCLGYGLLRIAKHIPVVATVHHPIPIDRRLELAHAPDWKRSVSIRRWYHFTRMQGRVARRLPRLVTVSESAKEDVCRELAVEPGRVSVVHNGVDTELFRPLPAVQRVPGRIITTASSDVPLKGLVFLIEALAKVRTERPAELVVIGKTKERGPVARAIERFGLESAVEFRAGVSWAELVELYAHAEVAVVPSLYEGFSLPAIEAMACGMPLVATTAGALPEVVGNAGSLVPPKDAGALASAIGGLLDYPARRAQLGEVARARAMDRFSWTRTAEGTVSEYRDVIESC
ncbi:MAG TPA: glycosyltransferase family 4 protein [Actinomycetota bacterium]|jgi:glycosyltransferase involved in cell wall biosynthesis